ncbi:MAG TPA: hypothetical protein VKF39_05205 [Nitrososphaerales archaeon]|nr:hypothetical protein [Nitrososphaerales archaeon]
MSGPDVEVEITKTELSEETDAAAEVDCAVLKVVLWLLVVLGCVVGAEVVVAADELNVVVIVSLVDRDVVVGAMVVEAVADDVVVVDCAASMTTVPVMKVWKAQW